jgi:hypothetical protein
MTDIQKSKQELNYKLKTEGKPEGKPEEIINKQPKPAEVVHEVKTQEEIKTKEVKKEAKLAIKSPVNTFDSTSVNTSVNTFDSISVNTDHVIITIDNGTNTVDINENWSGANLETLSQWIQISCLQIEVLDLAIKYFRSIVRKNVLLGLVFSTASGSISLSQMGSGEQRIVYNAIFTVMSFSIAIFTGLIKIYQIQERLEEIIQLKQEWIGFSVVITTEVQLPVGERTLALDLISKNKNKYLDLLKHDVDIPNFIKKQANKNLYHDKEQYFKNLNKYKKLKEISCCTDEQSFLTAAREFELEKDESILPEKEPERCRWANCASFGFYQCCFFILELYKYYFNNKDKYIGEKTALSNIILSVIMEEENEQRSAKNIALLNTIRERKTRLEKDMAAFALEMKSNKIKFKDSMMG